MSVRLGNINVKLGGTKRALGLERLMTNQSLRSERVLTYSMVQSPF